MAEIAGNPIENAVLPPIVHPVVDLREVKSCKGNSNNPLFHIMYVAIFSHSSNHSFINIHLFTLMNTLTRLLIHSFMVALKNL